MQAGADVIFQATFFDGRRRAYPDFLIRHDDRPSVLGDYAYDVADTKLAKRVKAAAIIQMCVYGDLLEQVQGIPPETIAVITGDRASHVEYLADYAAYYRAAKARFGARIDPGAPPVETYPEPVDHCRVCNWWTPASTGAARTTIFRSSRTSPAPTAVVSSPRASTRSRGLRSSRPTRPSPSFRHGSWTGSVARLHSNSVTDATTGFRYELIPPDDDVPGRGLAALPAPSRLDVFFDIEADPWAVDEGLEYLFGWVEIVDGEPRYEAIWAHDRAKEGQCSNGSSISCCIGSSATRRCTCTTTVATSRAR